MSGAIEKDALVVSRSEYQQKGRKVTKALAI